MASSDPGAESTLWDPISVSCPWMTARASSRNCRVTPDTGGNYSEVWFQTFQCGGIRSTGSLSPMPLKAFFILYFCRSMAPLRRSQCPLTQEPLRVATCPLRPRFESWDCAITEALYNPHVLGTENPLLPRSVPISFFLGGKMNTRSNAPARHHPVI